MLQTNHGKGIMTAKLIDWLPRLIEAFKFAAKVFGLSA